MLNALEKIKSVLEAPLLRLGSSAISLSSIAQLLIIALVVLAVAFGLKRFLSLHLLNRLGLKQGTRESVAVITSYALATPLGIVLLQAAGINLASLTVIAGSLGVGIGFGLQEITKNFVSGLALLLERKLKVGDFVEAGEISGYIDEISLRSTVIRTVTQKHVIVPNSDLISNRVTNWTYSNFKGWVILPISVTHESDPILVIEVLMDSAYLEETVSLEYPPEVLFFNIGENSLDFKLLVWINRIDLKFETESSLHFIILQNLKKHGLRLASPRLDVWQRNPNVVVASSPEDYSQHAGLLRSQEANLDKFSKPVPTRDLLKQLPFFENCTELELRKLVEIGYRKRLETSEILYKEGDPGDAFYIILYGAVGYTLQATEKTTILKAGQFVGEFSLMLGVPRTVTVGAFEDTMLFVISPQGFKKLLCDQPQLYNLIIAEMGRHEEELSQQGRQLRELGLINSEEYNRNPIDWIRNHLERLFSP